MCKLKNDSFALKQSHGLNLAHWVGSRKEFKDLKTSDIYENISISEIGSNHKQKLKHSGVRHKLGHGSSMKKELYAEFLA